MYGQGQCNYTRFDMQIKYIRLNEPSTKCSNLHLLSFESDGIPHTDVSVRQLRSKEVHSYVKSIDRDHQVRQRDQSADRED